MGVVRDPTFLRQRVGQVTMQGIMIGTIFWQTDQDALKIALFFMFTGEIRNVCLGTHAGLIAMPLFPIHTERDLVSRVKFRVFRPRSLTNGRCFFCKRALFLLQTGVVVSSAAIGAMGNMATMPIIQSKRNVFYKQRDSGFYPTILYALSDYWADYPQQIFEVSILGFIVYFFVGFQASSFGLFYGFLFLSTLMFINLYKAIAVHTATKTAAQVRFDPLDPKL
jgi:hypothetical protein